MSNPIYLDYQATTPVDDGVLAAMLPYFTSTFGNAASIDHTYGSDASTAVEQAREQVGALLSSSPDAVVFTSGATESNNLAILGLADGIDAASGHIVTVETEHPAVLDPCLALEKRGWSITRLPVPSTGLVDPEDVRTSMRRDTRLVSVMAANNEIGVLSPLQEIAGIAAEHDVPLHCDATQAAGIIPINANLLGNVLISVSGHKMYGPKGVGALVIADRRQRRKLHPRQFGGGHERGLRSGTLNVPGIVGLGRASQLALEEMGQASTNLLGLRNGLWALLKESIPGVELNGDPITRLPNNLNVYIPGVNSRALLVQVKGRVAISTGSACGSAKAESSHVIAALRLGEDRAPCSIRISIGRPTSARDTQEAAGCLADAVRKLR
jgi:cysteine desulfurase